LTAPSEHALTIAPEMACAMMALAIATEATPGQTALPAALVQEVRSALVTASARTELASAPLDGRATTATLAPACTIALTTDTATTEPASATQDTAARTALCPPHLCPVSVPSAACVAA